MRNYNQTIYYKIFKIKEGHLRFIKHGGEVKMGKWLSSKSGMVYDGSDRRLYKAGFHVFLSLEVANRYLRKYKDIRDKVIIPVKVRGIGRKPTNTEVFLANKLKV
jgi:hypothetical protein